MASCRFYRFCTDDTSGNAKFVSNLIYDSTNRDIIAVWSETRGALSPRILQFSRFNIDTLAPHDEVTVVGNGSSTQVGRAPLLRVMTTGGRYVTVYTDAGTARMEACESSDSGATWGSGTDVSTNNHSNAAGLADDGTDLHLLSTWTSVQTGRVTHNKRTGADTWAADVTSFTQSATVEPGQWSSLQPSQAPYSMYMTSATVGMVVGFRTIAGEAIIDGFKRVTCLTTADGWATTTKVDIKTHTAANDGAIHSVKDSTGRIYVMWHDPDNSEKPYLAYTEDTGATWTLIGTPAIISSTMTDAGLSACDRTYDSFLALDARDNVLVGFSTQNALTPDFHYVFRGKTVGNDYVMASQCGYDLATDQIATNTVGHAIVAENVLYRCISKVLDAGEATERGALYFLVIEDAPIPDESPEPESPPPALFTGADDNNMMLRIDVAEGRGWSLHTVAPGCFMSWDEGDAETGREVPIIVIGNPSIDAQTQDPALIAGLTRIETGKDDGYGRRVYVDAGDTQDVRYDPLRVVIRSKVFDITEPGDTNIVRQAFFNYSFDAPDPTARLPVQVWVDGERLNRVIELPPTGGLRREEWFSLPTNANVGSTVQFIVDESSVWPFAFDTWGISYIKKGRRS